MDKALQGIDKKIVLDKAITDDALWTAYLEGRLPAGDKILPLKEETYSPVFGYVSGADAMGHGVAENRVMEVFPDGTHSKPVRWSWECPWKGISRALNDPCRRISRFKA